MEINNKDKRTIGSAAQLLEHCKKLLKYQRAGKEFWPNREEAEAVIIQLWAIYNQAAKEMPKLSTMQAVDNKVRCGKCHAVRFADDSYKCFDCKVYFCEPCAKEHFRGRALERFVEDIKDLKECEKCHHIVNLDKDEYGELQNRFLCRKCFNEINYATGPD